MRDIRVQHSALAIGVCLASLTPHLLAQATQVYWGDTHLHTSHSTDSFGSGNTLVDPDQAYRYARGEPVLHPTLRTRVRIPQPLDFLVVADHSDFLGLQVFIQKDDPALLASPTARRMRALTENNPASLFRMMFGGDPEITIDDMLEAYRPVMLQPWLDEIEAAERHNEPGVFTAFAGWEWTSHRDSRNLHRVVFSPAAAEALQSFFPYSSLDSTVPEDLWAWLEVTSADTGADFIAIPHNSNMSTGLMFDLVDSNGRPISADYARTRVRWEPVMEVTQVKGTSEAHPALSPNDEFADFEIFRRLFFAQAPVPNAGDYARSALLRGLAIEQRVGINPYKFGLIGSSDSHTGLSYTAENDFYGAVVRDALPEARAAAPRSRPPNLGATLAAWELSASGLAAVWATENTRAAIAAAFKRKEVYASSGPRIALRVFGGFDFRAGDRFAEDVAAIGYARGVPMGGDLTGAPPGRAPTFLIHAAMDPQGARLDRVQVVKGWLDAAGQSHERIHEAAWSGNRSLNGEGWIPPVDNTVDAGSASYDNTVGAPQLAIVWEDPDFDPAQLAFYYVRVLEIPTPRHQVYDAVALGLDPAETVQPLSIQERAWSSPIWYTP